MMSEIEPWREKMRARDRGHLARFDQEGRPMTTEEFRQTLAVWDQKSGAGDKQVTVSYVRDKDDPDASGGSQTTVIAKEAVEWHIERRYRSYLRGLFNHGKITFEAMLAQTPATEAS
jgi:hypothetical protein